MLRAALISIAGQPRDAAGGAGICIGGKPLARRQLEFALAAGAERIILLGGEGGAEADALHRAADRAGAKVQQIETAHGLLGTVVATDELLVLAPGLLPEAPEALDLLAKGSAVLVLPAAVGVAAGFERVDLERAWGGAAIVPGRLVERLAGLPADSEAASALLRVALQARIPERELPAPVLAEGSWAMIDAGKDPAAAERSWLRRNLRTTIPARPSEWLAHRALQQIAGSLVTQPRSLPALLTAAGVLLAAAVVVAILGVAPLAFGLVVLGAFIGEVATAFGRLAAAPFAAGKRERSVALSIDALAQAALLVCAVLAIEQDWLHRLFPPLVLAGLIRTLRPPEWIALASLVGDAVVLGLVLAVAAALGLVEPAIMVLTLAILAIHAAQPFTRRG